MNFYYYFLSEQDLHQLGPDFNPRTSFLKKKGTYTLLLVCRKGVWVLEENQNGMSSVAHSGRSVARCGAFEFRPMLYFGELQQI